MDDPDNIVVRLMRDLEVDTQGELAAILEVEPGTVSRWKTGAGNPRGKKLARQLIALGLSPEDYGLRRPVVQLADRPDPYGARQMVERLKRAADEQQTAPEWARVNHEQVMAALADLREQLVALRAAQ